MNGAFKPLEPAKLHKPVVVKVTKNGSKYMEAERHCVRCGGYGVVNPWGTCFRCGGSGIDPRPEHYWERTEDEQRKYEKRRQAQYDRAVEKARERFMAMKPLTSLVFKWKPKDFPYDDLDNGMRYEVLKETDKAVLLSMCDSTFSGIERWLPKSCLESY